MKKYVTWKKSDIILRSLRSHVLTDWLIDRTEFGRIVHRRHFIDWYHDFIYHISSSGNDLEVFLVDDHRVFDNIYCVRRKVRSADKQVDHCYQLYQAYQIHITSIRLWEVVSFYCILSVIYIVYNWQQKVQFSRISCVVSAVVSNIASVKLHLKYYKYVHIVW